MDEKMINKVLGNAPWSGDVEAWLEVSNAAEIAEDIDRYAIAVAQRAIAQERERCAQIAEDYDDADTNMAFVIASKIRSGDAPL